MVKLIQGDCTVEIPKLDPESVDLTVTSPPYDNLRTYNGSLEWTELTWCKIIRELYRVTKQGGVVVWVVGDAVINRCGSESLTSFRQALCFRDAGFLLHDTMIFKKKNAIPLNHNRYNQEFEYMFVFSKSRPKTFNPITERCRIAGKIQDYAYRNGTDKIHKRNNDLRPVKDEKTKGNIWTYNVGGESTGHPAIFPIQLAIDHIKSWSNEGDTVLDPFTGSGTTGIAARILRRKFIGIEKDPEYFKISTKRIEDARDLFTDLNESKEKQEELF